MCQNPGIWGADEVGEGSNSGGMSEFISLLETFFFFFGLASISPASNSFLGSKKKWSWWWPDTGHAPVISWTPNNHSTFSLQDELPPINGTKTRGAKTASELIRGPQVLGSVEMWLMISQDESELPTSSYSPENLVTFSADSPPLPPPSANWDQTQGCGVLFDC